MAAGRPTKYTPELARKICELVATDTDNSLPYICSMNPDLPTAETIRVWRWEKPEFSAMYAQAKMFQAELMAEKLLELCDVKHYTDEHGVQKVDPGTVARQRLKVDTVKWQAAKLAPKIYGDRKVEEQSNPQETLSKIQALVADLNKTNVSDI